MIEYRGALIALRSTDSFAPLELRAFLLPIPRVPPSLQPGSLSDFGAGFGPKGLGNLAQALAWVALFLRASPVRAPDNAGPIHIDRTQIQMTISSAPSGLVAFIGTPPSPAAACLG
jgi:hypothetical protein